jgi:phosphatidylglycerophosphatase A
MKLARLVASGFGMGRVPVAAGTAASVVATLLGAGLLLASPVWLALVALAATFGGYWAVASARIEGDPGWVTIDEFAGQFIVLLGLPHVSPGWLVAAFLLFRVLDITKLGPVGWAERKHGAFGVMADDVIAGILGALVLLAAGLVDSGRLALFG